MKLPRLTENAIREGATAESFRRGQDYYGSGSVFSLVRRGDVVEAEVEGSQPEPYAVRVEFDEGGVIAALCDCPYDWGGWCKHIVATLLACVHEPGSISERPPLEQLLAGLSRDQLQLLLMGLAEEEPRLAAAIESRIALVIATASAAASPTGISPAPRGTPVDPTPFRREVRESLRGVDYRRSSDAFWQVGEAVRGVHRVLDRAWDFVRAGDGRNALVVLEAVTEEFLSGFESLDDSYGHVGDFFRKLGPAWAEALLSAELTSQERQGWSDKLEAWQDGVEDYGIDEVFDVALEAAEQGWDFPPLQRILREGLTELEEPELEAALWDDELVRARLNVLERQARQEEYLRLARAAGQVERCVTMLVRLGRVGEAVGHGLEHLTTTDGALVLAKELRERGELEPALEIAQHGLTLGGRKAILASWLRDLAAGMGRSGQALSAARVAFEEEVSLAAYLRVRELAGEGWTAVQPELLDRARKVTSYSREGPVDILLHEGLIEDAIAVVNEGATHTLVEWVVDAAMGSHPDWVIQACQRQAEEIMDGGKAQYYDAAARWLGRARNAYRATGRDDKWRAYLDELLARHGRKHKLVPMLKALK
jgi:uncharacterized Zn finger protein